MSSRTLAAALTAVALLCGTATAAAAPPPVAAPECGGTAADWAAPDDTGALYQGSVRSEQHGRAASVPFLVHLTLDDFRLSTDEADGTDQWEVRHYYGEPSPSVLLRSPWGATTLSDPRCEDPAHPTRVTSTTATVKDGGTGRLTRTAF